MINMAFMPLYMWEMWDVTPVTDTRTHEQWKEVQYSVGAESAKTSSNKLASTALGCAKKGVGLQTSIFDFPFSVLLNAKNGLHHYKTVPHIINHVSFHLLSTTERESTGLGASYKWEILQRYAQNQVTLLTTLHLLAELTNQRVENWRNWNCLQRYFKSRNSPVSSFISRVAFP